MFDLRPSDELITRYRASGVWRTEGPVDDLRRWSAELPEETAIVDHRAGSAAVRLTYSEYVRYVERFAAALHELGVRPGQVVAIQLPNWWQLNALILACARIGAVVAPIMPTIGPRELERFLARLDAVVCVTADHWSGTARAAALAEMAPRLPRLRHRVVLGAETENGVDFVQHFERTAWEQRHPMPLDEAAPDPDRVAIVLFTSGTSGEPKGVMHSFNTIYAGASAVIAEEKIGTSDTLFTPHTFTHIAGLVYGVFMPLLGGATSALLDTWSPEAAFTLMSETDTTLIFGAPPFISGLTETARGQGRSLPALRIAFSGATAVPEQIIAEFSRVFGLPLRRIWGMTEIPAHTWTRTEDPADRAMHSDGRPGPGLELRLRGDGPISKERPAQLLARGGGVCLATLGRDSGELRIVAEHDDGWYDTGDLAIADGQDGIRIIGRASDRISNGASMIPVNDVETELLKHPAVADVALIGYPDGQGGESACAVVVSRAPERLELADLRGFLSARGMTEWYQPSQLRVVAEMPRNATGKIRKELLRRWLRGEAELTD
jgi:cyclohexanecarboxylate-CoA ligase